MQIGTMIRKYRKERGLTQEEMARRLGVTAPAVNKWENGGSMPDISLLAPIGRLLHVSMDELLSFKEDLTKEEIAEYVREADRMLKEKPYEEVFDWAKKVLKEYPDCGNLLWQIALILDANRLLGKTENPEKYDEPIIEWYERAAESPEEEVRTGVYNSLFALYMRNENYEEAEKCLDHFSIQNPERKRKKADLAWKRGDKQAAYQAQEELIFSEFQMITMSLQSLYMMALEGKDFEKARYLVQKQKEVARASDMGRYHEETCGLELLIEKKDVNGTYEWAQRALANASNLWEFIESPLYEHMTFKQIDEKFVDDMRENLKESFRDEETFGYMTGDIRWKELLEY